MIDLGLAVGLEFGRRASSLCIASMVPNSPRLSMGSLISRKVDSCTFLSHLAFDLAQCTHARMESTGAHVGGVNCDMIRDNDPAFYQDEVHLISYGGATYLVK